MNIEEFKSILVDSVASFRPLYDAVIPNINILREEVTPFDEHAGRDVALFFPGTKDPLPGIVLMPQSPEIANEIRIVPFFGLNFMRFGITTLLWNFLERWETEQKLWLIGLVSRTIDNSAVSYTEGDLLTILEYEEVIYPDLALVTIGNIEEGSNRWRQSFMGVNENSHLCIEVEVFPGANRVELTAMTIDKVNRRNREGFAIVINKLWPSIFAGMGNMQTSSEQHPRKPSLN